MANEKVREVKPMRGHRGPGGPKPKVENPGMIMKRLVGYVFAKYKFHFVAVIVCILLSSLMTLRGTWFMQSLIDDYIAYRRDVKKNKDATINHALEPIISACERAKDEGLIDTRLYADIKDCRVVELPNLDSEKFDGKSYLTKEQLKKLIEF